MEYHLISLVIHFRCKIVEEKYLYLGENLAVVTLPLYDDVTTERFAEKILCFKSYENFELAL